MILLFCRIFYFTLTPIIYSTPTKNCGKEWIQGNIGQGWNYDRKKYGSKKDVMTLQRRLNKIYKSNEDKLKVDGVWGMNTGWLLSTLKSYINKNHKVKNYNRNMKLDTKTRNFFNNIYCKSKRKLN